MARDSRKIKLVNAGRAAWASVHRYLSAKRRRIPGLYFQSRQAKAAQWLSRDSRTASHLAMVHRVAGTGRKADVDVKAHVKLGRRRRYALAGTETCGASWVVYMAAWFRKNDRSARGEESVAHPED
jgi:hypothetical protein